MVHSHIMYCINIYGCANATTLNKLVSHVSHAKYRDHTNPLFKKLGILPLHDLIKYSALKFMHDFKHTCLPFSFNEFHVQAHNSPPPSPLPIYEAKLCLKNLQLRPRLYGASGIITWPSGHTRLSSLLLTSFAPSIAFCTRAPIFIILSYSLNPTCLQFSPLVTYIVYTCLVWRKIKIWFDLIWLLTK
jgi:hypothetical protein